MNIDLKKVENSFEDFIEAYEEFFPDLSDSEKFSKNKEEDRKDYCYKCNDEGEWVMMALKCKKCKKVLIGG